MTQQAIPLAVRCPDCGSAAVVYSCDPHCCFNHVCADCRASFFLTTRLLGEAGPEVAAPAVSDSDPTAPTAPCDRCGSLKVWSVTGGEPASAADPVLRGICIDCRALLAVLVTTEAP